MDEEQTDQAADVGRQPLALDNSQTNIGDYQKCPKYYMLTVVAGYFPKIENKNLRMGHAYHLGQDVRHKHEVKRAEVEISKYYGGLFPLFCDEDWFSTEAYDTEIMTVISMMKHSPWDMGEVMESEKEFYVPIESLGLTSKYVRQFCGKIDGVVQNKVGKLMLIDWKTQSRETLLSAEVVERNLQASFYFHVARRMNWWPVEGMQFRYITKPTIRQRKKESLAEFRERIDECYRTREDYYSEVDTYRDPNDMRWFTNMQHTLDQIDYSIDNNAWVEHYHTCEGYYGGGCRYLPICQEETGAFDKFDCFGYNHHPELTEK